MLPAVEQRAGSVRILRRRSARACDTVVRVKRPSVLDPRLCGDPWIVRRHSGKYALCFDVWEMAAVQAIPLDLPSLNSLLHRMRHRYPRRRRCIA
jgi:hypothetical protein